MNTLKVGSALTVIAMLTMAMPALGAHPDYYHDELREGVTTWHAAAGDLAIQRDHQNSPDPTKLMEPSWLRLQDEDGTTAGTSLAYKKASSYYGGINASLERYEVELLMERGHNFTAPGASSSTGSWIGVAFGLQEDDGYFLWAINTDAGVMSFNVPDSSGGYMNADTSPYQGSPRFTALAGMDWEHNYEVEVDGRHVTLFVDGAYVADYDLDDIAADLSEQLQTTVTVRDPVGTFGVAAGENTQVWVQRARYLPLDNTAPEITLIDTPEAGSLDIAGITSVPWITSQAAIAGDDFSFAAEVTDDVVGLDSISVYVDGEKQYDLNIGDDPDDGIYSWTIDVSDLGLLGSHEITIKARDLDGNWDREGVSFEVFVLNADPADLL